MALIGNKKGELTQIGPLNGMAYKDFHDLNISFAIYTFTVAHPIVVVVVQSHRLGIPSAPRCCNARAAQQ